MRKKLIQDVFLVDFSMKYNWNEYMNHEIQLQRPKCKEFTLDEVLERIFPHAGHNGDMVIERLMNNGLTAVAICIRPDCGITVHVRTIPFLLVNHV